MCLRTPPPKQAPKPRSEHQPARKPHQPRVASRARSELPAPSKERKEETEQVPSHSERSRDIKDKPRKSCQELHSNDWYEISAEASTLGSGSRHMLLKLCKKPPRLISLASLRIQICAPSTLSVSPSWKRTWSLQEESVATPDTTTAITSQRPDKKISSACHTETSQKAWPH